VWASIGQAAGLFAVTNIDDIVILALFFGRAGSSRSAAMRIVVGQYLGFAAILAISVLGALGAQLLPPPVIPYLGLLPLALGVRAAWNAWREHRAADRPDRTVDTRSGTGALTVAAVTLANGGDNIGVYVPVFTTVGSSQLVIYAVVFLALVALWCATGWFFATRPCDCSRPLTMGTHPAPRRAHRHRPHHPRSRGRVPPLTARKLVLCPQDGAKVGHCCGQALGDCGRRPEPYW
jgi:cadmium resistance protein CadD (predicted permease)